MNNRNHFIRELEQEKFLLEELNKYHESLSSEYVKIVNTFNQDVRTPLVVIKGYTDMLLAGKFGNITEKQREKLLYVQKSIESLVEAVFEAIKQNPSL